MGTREPSLRAVLPGLAVLGGIAVLARVAAAGLPHVNALVLAVGIGAVAGNLGPVPRLLRPGLDQHKLLLETGIVLLGASIPLSQIAGAGPVVVALVLGTVAFGVVAVEALSRWPFALPRRSGSLLAAGASICGVSAVVAVARGIDADRETLAYAAGAILLFDAVTLVVFPAVGGLLDLPDRVFGVWAGLAMFSTGPVAAAGFAHSPAAGKWATFTKLVRNAFIGALAVGYSLAYLRRDRLAGGDGGGDGGPDVEGGPESGGPVGDGGSPGGLSPVAIWEQFPKFLVGFLVVVAVANAGVVSPAGLSAVETVSEWLFAVAFVGVGFSIRIEEMRRAGLAPVAVLLVYLVLASALTLAAVTFLL